MAPQVDAVEPAEPSRLGADRVPARKGELQQQHQRAAGRRPGRARCPQDRNRRPAPAPAAPRRGVEQGDPAGARRPRAARPGRLGRQHQGPAQDLAAGGRRRAGRGRLCARSAPLGDGSTARGAGRSGARHAMAVNETVAAFVLGGSAPGAAGGVGTVRSWSTETEFLLPGGRRKVRPDGVWQVTEIGVPVLMVEVDRSTMAPADVAAKFPRYRELFRVKVRDNDPARSGLGPADRMVHWCCRTWPAHSRAGYSPVGLVVTGAGPVALASWQEAVADLSAGCWRGSWWTVRLHDNDGDGWREYDDAVPVIVTTLELLAEHGPIGPV
ncbi:replication-relaxation family protein [Kitasatospora paracochleata]|uniref:replication-relaxation family protein n=1 Tax=Kitasatospora paracochleata TaxID=58354 RepID=UPI0027DFDEFF|nr:replication-relaxation family protein [Kitasatospora paracochleata]